MQNNHREESDYSNKKKLVLINTCLYGSTGRIVRNLEKLAGDNNYEIWTVSAYERNHRVEFRQNDIVIGSFVSRYFHLLLSRLLGVGGLFSVVSTMKLVRKLKRICPDIVHLHNLHNAFINVGILFHYLKKYKIRTIWTLHDCWAFTGRCPYFDMVNCMKWQTGCGAKCPFPPREYPVGYCNNTGLMWRYKKKCYKGMTDLTIVTPSEWLSSLVRMSILGCYSTIVINNGIDLSVFRPSLGTIREQFGIKRKYIVLGVALCWDKRKGIDAFLEIDQLLSDDYQIVLVGVTPSIEKQVPNTIICIRRTESQKQLAELYSIADVFVNPTREDNFPTVNIESLACGTPVITFNTGGSPEAIDNTCGFVIDDEDCRKMAKAIVDVCENRVFSRTACLKRASKFDMYKRFEEYIGLYQQL